MKEYHVTVRRQDASGKQWDQSYTAVFEDDEIVSVMNVLDYIYRNLDSTLAYFDHAACHQAACGKCMLKVNGQPRLACKEVAAVKMLLEPVNRQKTVRDLICAN